VVPVVDPGVTPAVVLHETVGLDAVDSSAQQGSQAANPVGPAPSMEPDTAPEHDPFASLAWSYTRPSDPPVVAAPSISSFAATASWEVVPSSPSSDSDIDSSSDSSDSSNDATSASHDRTQSTATASSPAAPAIPRVRQRYDVRPDSCDFPRPTPIFGTEWWFDVLWPQFARLRSRLPDAPHRPLLVEHLCAGAGTDFMAWKVLGVGVHCLAACETKPMARSFLKSTFGPDLGSWFEFNTDLLEQTAFCHLAERDKPVPSDRPDLTSIGSPCLPWTKGRSRNGGTARSGAPHLHPDYQVTMHDFPRHLRSRRPRSWWLENVPEIATTPCIDCEEDGDGKRASDLWQLCFLCCQAGYAVRTIEIDHNLFVEVPRKRPCTSSRPAQ
jgi:hypothetical protein